jgi:bifunctional protein TilS/HprT
MAHIALTTLRTWEKEGFLILVSGGVDSMVLLDLCRMYHPHILHFDHQVRKESIQDHALLLEYATTHGLTYHKIELTLPKKNFQHEAHLLRQIHAIDYAKTHQLKHVLTAHHADDLIETMLIKMIRGSHLEGYIGMKSHLILDGIHFHKPLLNLTKNDLLAYAKDHHITYLEDQSNFKDDYLRNRLRHHVIPMLKEENTSLHTSFEKLSSSLIEAHTMIHQVAQSFILNRPWSIHTFKTLEHSVQKEIISIQLKTHHVSPTYSLIQQLLKLLLNGRPNQKHPLSETLVFLRSYETWSILENKKIDQVVMTLEEQLPVTLNNMIFTYFHNPIKVPSKTVKICYNQLAFPLVLRHRQNGDTLQFSYGHKKLKSYLIDQKIPLQTRDELWILSDQHHTILWIQHLYTNQELGNQHTLYLHIEEVAHAS